MSSFEGGEEGEEVLVGFGGLDGGVGDFEVVLVVVFECGFEVEGEELAIDGVEAEILGEACLRSETAFGDAVGFTEEGFDELMVRVGHGVRVRLGLGLIDGGRRRASRRRRPIRTC